MSALATAFADMTHETLVAEALRLHAELTDMKSRPRLEPAARDMAIAAISAVIAEIDACAHGVLECCSTGASCDPATLDDEDREEYECLVSLARRAECALALLGAAR